MSTLYDGPYDQIVKKDNFLTLIWKAKTAEMQTKDFFDSMVRLGHLAIEKGASGLLIDVREFKHKPTEDVMAYRKEHVIPLYNKAGIKRMSFLFPENSLGEASQDPGGNYVVERFNSKIEAERWTSLK